MKRVATMVLALIMTVTGLGLTALAGTTDLSAGGDSEFDYARVTWFFNEGGQQITPESYVVQKALEDINVELVHVTLPSGMDYTERLMVLVAGGDTPDVIDTDKTMISKLLQEDLIIPLEDYMTKEYIPNIMRISADWDSVMEKLVWSDGHIYTIPSVKNNPLTEHPWIRQDWLDKLELDMPTTLEELSDVLKAFSQGDPNGDGIAVYGSMANEFWGFAPYMDAFGAGLGWYPGEDGLPEIGILSPRIKEALAYCKDLIDSGAVNMDFVTTTYDQVNEKLRAGLVGYLYGWNGNEQLDRMREVYPDAEWVPMTPVKGVYDKGYINMVEPDPVRNWYAISKDCKDVEAVLRLMDYMATDTSDENGMTFEGSYWNALGVRGVNWDVINGICETGNGDSGDEAMAKKFRDQNTDIDKWVGSPSLRFRNQYDVRWMGVDERNVATMQFLLNLPQGKDIPDSDPLKPYGEMVIEDEVVTTFYDDYCYYKFAELFCYNALLGKGDIDTLYDEFLAKANSDGYQDVRQRMGEIVPAR